MNKETLKKIYKIFKGIFTVFLLMVLMVILVQRISRNNLSIGGIRIFSIISESMAPDYKIGDILIANDVSPKDINIGDRVTYKGVAGDLAGLVITHEVINKREENGKYYFVTKGTANDLADPEISEDVIYGKIIYKTLIFSLLGQLMSNIFIYYALFILVGISVSYQIVKNILLNRKEEEEIENENMEDSKKDI